MLIQLLQIHVGIIKQVKIVRHHGQEQSNSKII